ncbi:MAG: hypothetical protein ACJAZ9_001632 [Neolewinella sp.]|jgi:hypothetical protein
MEVAQEMTDKVRGYPALVVRLMLSVEATGVESRE